MNEKRLCAVLREKPRLEKKEVTHAGRSSIHHVLSTCSTLPPFFSDFVNTYLTHPLSNSFLSAAYPFYWIIITSIIPSIERALLIVIVDVV